MRQGTKRGPGRRVRVRAGMEGLEGRVLMSGAAAGLPAAIDVGASSEAGVSVAAGPGGAFVVAYTDTTGMDGSGEGIVARLYDGSGQAVGGPIVVNATTAGDQVTPRVAMDGGGNFVVAWTDTSSSQVEARRFDPAGNPLTGEIQVGSYDFTLWTDVGTDAAGNFVVSWAGPATVVGPDEITPIQFRMYGADGTARGSAQPIGSYSSVYSSRLSMNDAGGFTVIVYHDANGVDYYTYDASGVLAGSRAVYISSFNGADAIDDAGRTKSAWMDRNLLGGTVVAAWSPDGALEGRYEFGSLGTFGTTFIGMDRSSGRFVAGFAQDNEIEIQWFDEGGRPSGALTRVDAEVSVAFGGVNTGQAVSAAVGEGNAAVVAWVDSGTGRVMAQRLEAQQAVTVDSIAATSERTKNVGAGSVTWRVTFSGPVAGVTVSNFQLTSGGGLGGAPAITSVTPVEDADNAAEWLVTASTGLGAGTLGLSFVGGAGIEVPVTVINTLAGEAYTFQGGGGQGGQLAAASFAWAAAPAVTYGSGGLVTVSGRVVRAGGVVPTGLVTVSVGGVLASGVIGADGTFATTVGTGGLGVGTYEVQLGYAGDANSAGTSATLTLAVTPAATAFGAVAAPVVEYRAKSVTLSGRVTSAAAGVPTGRVKVRFRGVAQWAALAADGTFAAKFDAEKLAIGKYAAKFSYAGDESFGAARATGRVRVAYRAPAWVASVTRKAVALRVNVTDAAARRNLASNKVVVRAVGYAPVDGAGAMTPAAAAGGVAGQFTLLAGTYNYTLDVLRPLAKGVYRFYYKVAGDPVRKSVRFRV